jgi:hypothetical protein
MAENTKACPMCGEEILAVAVKCKHCGSMLTASSSSVGVGPVAAPAAVGGAPRDYSQVPWYRTNALAIACAFLFGPGLLLIAATGPIYYQRQGKLQKYSAFGRGLVLCWGLLSTIGFISFLSGNRAGKVSMPVHTAPSLAHTPVVQPEQPIPGQPSAMPVAVSETETALEFGKPTVVNSYGMTHVKVMTKNVSGRKLNCMLTGTFLRGDTILGTANGALNDIAPGSTKTAELLTTDKVKGYDTLKLEPSACF